MKNHRVWINIDGELGFLAMVMIFIKCLNFKKPGWTILDIGHIQTYLSNVKSIHFITKPLHTIIFTFDGHCGLYYKEM